MTLLREIQILGETGDRWRAVDGWIRDVRQVLNGGLSWNHQFSGGVKTLIWDPANEPTVFVSLPGVKAKPVGVYLLSLEESPRNDAGFQQSGGRVRWQWVETTRGRVGGIRITDIDGTGSGTFRVRLGIIGE